MKIISPFKDYYDRISGQYGGGDPSIPYLRLNKDPYQTVKIQYITNRFGNTDLHTALNRHIKMIHAVDQCVYELPSFRWLIFCGKCYLIIINKVPNLLPHEEKIRLQTQYKPVLGYINDSKVLSQKYNSDIYEYLINNSDYWDDFYQKKNSYLWNRDDPRRVYRLDDLIGKADSGLDELSKLLTNKMGRPIPMFTIEKDEFNSSTRRWLHGIEKIDLPINQLEINVNVCLNDLGFAAIMSAEQAYQHIESYIVNVLRDNPDKIPPVQVDDKIKIGQHGFDLKQSFRHRKE